MNITIQTNLTSQIHDVQQEAIKKENVDVESLQGMDQQFEVKKTDKIDRLT